MVHASSLHHSRIPLCTSISHAPGPCFDARCTYAKCPTTIGWSAFKAQLLGTRHACSPPLPSLFAACDSFEGTPNAVDARALAWPAAPVPGRAPCRHSLTTPKLVLPSPTEAGRNTQWDLGKESSKLSRWYRPLVLCVHRGVTSSTPREAQGKPRAQRLVSVHSIPPSTSDASVSFLTSIYYPQHLSALNSTSEPCIYVHRADPDASRRMSHLIMHV